MDTFVWDEHFTTGLELVDTQHHRLVDLINQLGDSLIGSKVADDGALQAVFRQLAEYAQYHFAEEEQLMAESGVAAEHRELHHGHHVQFIEQVARMWQSRATMSNPASILHGFLSSWLGFHILGEDQTMAHQIALIRAGNTADQAYEAIKVHKDNATSALLLALHKLYHVLSEQNRDLAEANTRLEDRVAERTQALAQANAALLQANTQLEIISRTDGLLGIANRQCFNERLEQEWLRAKREKTPLALLMLDVDHFKHYNDSYGHQAGDHCLQAVAQAVQLGLRRPADLVARYGGEEMVVILPNTEIEGARNVAANIAAQLAKCAIPHRASPVAAQVTLSIGAATMLPGQDNSADRLIAAADGALYTAKESGRNRICLA
ncbi:MAG: diguanylate cyclase [Sulfuricella sp.]|nr:diguanylate cyclase [Sulfuricella sp.]